MAALGLRCCVRVFSSCGKRGLLFVVVHVLLIAVAPLVAEHGFQACGLQQLWHMGSVIVALGLQSAGSVVVGHRLSCSAACGIFLDQGSNPFPLHWQAVLNHCATREVQTGLFLHFVCISILFFLTYCTDQNFQYHVEQQW